MGMGVCADQKEEINEENEEEGALCVRLRDTGEGMEIIGRGLAFFNSMGYNKGLKFFAKITGNRW